MNSVEIQDKTIAVLPFINMSGNQELEYFSDGITEEIINALASIEELKVTSRTSSFYFKNKQIPIKEIAEELKVSAILEGSVRLAAQTIRITAQLIHAQEDFHFWSETWDRKLDNIFEIQDEISLKIADKLREQYGHFEIGEHLVNKKTDSFDVYELSLKAKYLFNRWNPNDVREAITLFDQAIAIDPNHTDSYVGLADAYGFLAATELLPPLEAWQKARDYTNKAYTLDPDNAGVHYQLANLSFFQESNFKNAALHAYKAIELKPNYPEAQQFVSFLYMISEEMEKAKTHLDLAYKIDPLSQETLFYRAYYKYRTGDYEGALGLYTEILRNNPKNIPAYIVNSYCLLKLKRYDDAINFIEGLPKEIEVPDERLGILSLAYILKQDKPKANEYFQQLYNEAQKPHSYQAHSYLYLCYANWEKTEEAFSWLKQIMKDNSPVLLLSFTDPLANNLKTDKRYFELKQQNYSQADSMLENINSKTALMTEESAEEFKTLLTDHLSQEEPFLIPNLSLRLLADQLEIHPNKLSWLLNEGFGKNFNEFINHHRIEYFKKLALDSANSHISLIGLAYESGFNSKTVFNTYFKKETGMTPKEFINQAKKAK